MFRAVAHDPQFGVRNCASDNFPGVHQDIDAFHRMEAADVQYVVFAAVRRNRQLEPLRANAIVYHARLRTKIVVKLSRIIQERLTNRRNCVRATEKPMLPGANDRLLKRSYANVTAVSGDNQFPAVRKPADADDRKTLRNRIVHVNNVRPEFAHDAVKLQGSAGERRPGTRPPHSGIRRSGHTPNRSAFGKTPARPLLGRDFDDGGNELAAGQRLGQLEHRDFDTAQAAEFRKMKQKDAHENESKLRLP